MSKSAASEEGRRSVFSESPPDLNREEVLLLLKWGNPEKIPAPATDDPMFRLQVAKLLGNLDKWAKSFGPKLITTLVEAGYLLPEGDPVGALKEVLERARWYDADK